MMIAGHNPQPAPCNVQRSKGYPIDQLKPDHDVAKMVKSLMEDLPHQEAQACRVMLRGGMVLGNRQREDMVLRSLNLQLPGFLKMETFIMPDDTRGWLMAWERMPDRSLKLLMLETFPALGMFIHDWIVRKEQFLAAADDEWLAFEFFSVFDVAGEFRPHQENRPILLDA